MADGLVITGPTASGKTAIAIDVALRISGEIISVDSRQVYRGMDIGTAKPGVEQRAVVPHHGIDLLPPSERYSAGKFAADARAAIAGIRARGHVPVLTGGTGFFLRALTNPLFEEPAVDAERKEAIKKYLDSFDRQELMRWLHGLDERGAYSLRLSSSQRIARAIEVALLTGYPLSVLHDRQQPPAPMRFVTVVLNLVRSALYDRINRRVDDMLAAGLVEEVRALVAAGYDESAPGMNATGYVELLPYLRGETTLEEAAQLIRNTTRRYARRQLTWFRHQLPADALWLDASLPHEQLVDTIVQLWQEQGGTT